MTKQPEQDWDAITATDNGGIVWKRYSDGEIVVTEAGQTPEQALKSRTEGGHEGTHQD
jgi:hypothetical protein